MRTRYISLLINCWALLAVMAVLLPLPCAEAAPECGTGELGNFLWKYGSNIGFNTPMGVAVDGSGHIYVVDAELDRIRVFERGATVFANTWGTSGSEGGQFSRPHGITVDRSGNIYIADTDNNRIQVFDTQGTFLRMWGSYGSGDGQFKYPTSVAVDGSGNVYVADTYNDRIQVFDSGGTFLAKWGSSGPEGGQFSRPRGVAVDVSANVYVADYNNDRIQVFSSQGMFLRTWGSGGSGEGQFSNPWGVAVDASGNVYVSDYHNHRIQVFDSQGTFLRTWGSLGRGDGQFEFPTAVAVDASGSIYVADSNNHQIQLFDGQGALLDVWGYGTESLGSPVGVTVDGSENVYVTDRFLGLIHIIGGQGTIHTTWERMPGGERLWPWGIALNRDGLVYVSEGATWVNREDGSLRIDPHRIGVFDSLGNLLSRWGTYGPAPGQFDYPTGVAVDTSGNVYVADYHNHRIQVFNPQGAILRMWGIIGSGDGQFSYPDGIAVDVAGNVYVADRDNHRIQVFDSQGVFLRKWGSGGSEDGQFNHPSGVAVDFDGNVYVADQENHRIQVFDSQGAFLSKWGSYGDGDGQFRFPYGVIVGGSGNVYVADTINRRIQAFKGMAPQTADAQKPSSTTSINGVSGTNGWFVSDVGVVISATDSGSGDCSFTSGIKEIHAQVDGGGEAIYSGNTVSINLVAEGNHTVVYFAVDNAGNVEDPHTVEFKIDKTAPVATVVVNPIPNGAGWNNTQVTVRFSASDAISQAACNPAQISVTSEGVQQVVQATCTDQAGNGTVATATLNLDMTPPTITGAAMEPPGAYGWYKVPVTVRYTASDILSGVSAPPSDVVLSAEGSSQSATGIAADIAGNTASFSVNGINIDRTPPVIEILGIADGASYTLGAIPVADFTVTDTFSGVLSKSGLLTGGNATGVGTLIYTAKAVDKAGNSSSRSAVYRVVYGGFNDFLSPVNRDKPFRLGSTIPIKFRVTDAQGNYISTASATIRLQKFSSGVPDGDLIEATSTSGGDTGNTFRYDPSDTQYIFNLSTKGLSGGTWQIIVALDDGTIRTMMIYLKAS